MGGPAIGQWTRGRILRHPLSAMSELITTINQLEADLQESRQLNQRLAEITDVLAEVLLPAEQRDEERLADLLAKYDKAL